MTPQEVKAREIVIKMQFQSEPLMFEQAKKCALITVDEMLKHMSLHFGQIGLSTVEYWNEVKKEIEQL